jgi:hypothetical protein
MLSLLLSDDNEYRPTFQCQGRGEVRNAHDEADVNTVLHMAVASGDSSGAVALLKAEADCQINKEGQTPLEMEQEIP